MKRLENNFGMSFLEMMVSIAIFTVIMSSIFTVIYTGRLYWRVGTSQVDAQQQTRQAVSYMAKELRQTRSGTGRVAGGGAVAILEDLPTDDNPHTSVTFRIPQDTDGDGNILNTDGRIIDWSNRITYCLDSTNKQLIRLYYNQIFPSSTCTCQAASQANCTAKVLANSIDALQFTRSSGEPLLIRIRVNANKIIPGTSETINAPLGTWVRIEN